MAVATHDDELPFRVSVDGHDELIRAAVQRDVATGITAVSMHPHAGILADAATVRSPTMTVVALWKPYDVVCQFSRPANAKPGQLTLADLVDRPGLYPAGRLDRDSEGLVLLTDDGGLQARLTDPRRATARRYLVQVEGTPDTDAIGCLSDGRIVLDGRPVRQCEVSALTAEPSLPPRHPPIRERRAIPTTWLEMSLTEGRNRQVRRMTAAVGHPTLRLVRIAHGPVTLEGLQPGRWRELTATEQRALRDS
jgi:23S rRNA pseudouridine2457 synthase